MKALVALVLLAWLSLAAASGSPQAQLLALPTGTWLSYEVALQPGLRAPCCFTWRRGKVDDATCRLDRRDWNFGHRGGAAPASPGAALRILLRRGAEGFDRIHALGSQCAFETGDARVTDIGAVPASGSVALLEAALGATQESLRPSVLAAIAYHDSSLADAALERAAAGERDEDLRRDAVFWLAEARGERGWRHVFALLEREADAELRRHFLFAISMSDEPSAQEALRHLARSAAAEVRGEAIFWLAQNEDPQTEALVRTALAEQGTDALNEKCVFALSQLPPQRAIPALRALLESPGSRSVRKQAMFWLAQVDDDAVLPVFDALLDPRD